MGTEGCSRFFAVGLLDAADPEALADELHALRARLLADPYFRDVPSMQISERKTAVQFHAKDDLPEVRREVLALLARHPLSFAAVIKDKRVVLEYVRNRNQSSPAYRYAPNELYDYVVRRLFKERLHKHGAYRICFAIRGNRARTAALRLALESARSRYANERGLELAGELEVRAAHPGDEPLPQAVDYFLWALQRVYERHEDRFLRMLWDRCSLIVDADDTRRYDYGEYYNRGRLLTADEVKRG